jgi:hypothetical protein
MLSTDDELVAALHGRAESAKPTDTPTPRERRPPASEETVMKAEVVLGFRLDPLLRRIYREVCDGGIGPGYGSLPLMGNESVLSMYENFRSGSWPEKLMPVWDWGGACWSCVDLEGRIVTNDEHGPTLTDFTTRTWLKAWVGGVDLWKEIYEDKDATIINPFTKKPIATKVRGTAKGRPWLKVN